VIAAGNASQFSDGASACVVMDAKRGARSAAEPLGIFRGFASRRLRARRDGHRAGVRDPEAAQARGLKVGTSASGS
jgi:acetyl-CoA C-acetyltransferase